tara:strand:+ start:329 stop:571 length:243 start_codon:yes stop_codon:yes gene_type:complete
MTEQAKTPTVSNPVEAVVSRPLLIRGTSPYSFRNGEWAAIIDTQNRTPEGLPERPVYILKYSDGMEDSIAISDTKNYELG